MVLELPESAAQQATDPKRVYYVGAGFQPLPAPGAPFFNEALPQTVPLPPNSTRHARRSEAGELDQPSCSVPQAWVFPCALNVPAASVAGRSYGRSRDRDTADSAGLWRFQKAVV